MTGRVFADFVRDILNGGPLFCTARAWLGEALLPCRCGRGFFTVLLSGQPARPYNVANPIANAASPNSQKDLLRFMQAMEWLSNERRAAIPFMFPALSWELCLASTS